MVYTNLVYTIGVCIIYIYMTDMIETETVTKIDRRTLGKGRAVYSAGCWKLAMQGARQAYRVQRVAGSIC